MLNSSAQTALAENVQAPSVEQRRIALLCDYCEGIASTIIDHIEGLIRCSAHQVTPINFRGDLPAMVELDRFDAVVVHYSLIACKNKYLTPTARSAIRSFAGLKIAFVQDDYRFIDDTVQALRTMGVHILFGLVQEEIIDEVYAPAALPGVRRETVLAGYVPENLLHRSVPSVQDRPIDIGYRARKLPAWLGSHAQEKWRIAEGVLKDADRFQLCCDISCNEQDRLYGDRWIDFLGSCKAVLGTESGASVCDFTGEIQAAVEAHLVREPNTSFETLRGLYFKDVDRRLTINVISPRCFEAAALRTLMILYEGTYSGRLEPWRHFLPLKKDHSNMDEIVAILRDAGRVQEIVDRTYDEVALNPDNGFGSMVRQVDDAINATFSPVMKAVKPFYTEQDLSRLVQRSARQARRRHQLEEQQIRRHVAAVQALDRALGLLPDGLRGGLREGIRRAFHWQRAFRDWLADASLPRTPGMTNLFQQRSDR